MVYEYQHRLRLYEIGSYLKHYVDDHAIAPFDGTFHGTLESHVRFLLMEELHHAQRLRAYLSRLLPSMQVDRLVDAVHDMLLVELRPFLNLDEGETVVDVRIHRNYDIDLTVEELDGAHLATA